MPGRGEENKKELNLDSQVSGQGWKAGSSKHEAEMLSCRFGCLALFAKYNWPQMDTMSVCLSVTYYRRLNLSSNFHAIQ